jgi:alkylation response protein AidB-like acyl-CoA dehydrogenase
VRQVRRRLLGREGIWLMSFRTNSPRAAGWASRCRRNSAAHFQNFGGSESYDSGRPCRAPANAAEYLAADSGLEAGDRAIRTHGGTGYAQKYHVERCSAKWPQRNSPRPRARRSYVISPSESSAWRNPIEREPSFS